MNSSISLLLKSFRSLMSELFQQCKDYWIVSFVLQSTSIFPSHIPNFLFPNQIICFIGLHVFESFKKSASQVSLRWWKTFTSERILRTTQCLGLRGQNQCSFNLSRPEKATMLKTVMHCFTVQRQWTEFKLPIGKLF